MLIKMGTKKVRRSNNHNVIVRNYEHYNRSFQKWDSPRGRYISSKRDYEKALHEEGMMTQDEAVKEGAIETPRRHEYKVSKDTLDLIESVSLTADKHGNIKPGDKAIERLRKKKPNDYNRAALPAHYQDKGGMS